MERPRGETGAERGGGQAGWVGTRSSGLVGVGRSVLAGDLSSRSSALEPSRARPPESPLAFASAIENVETPILVRVSFSRNDYLLREPNPLMAKDKSKKAAAASAVSDAALKLTADKKALDPALASLFATSVSSKISHTRVATFSSCF